MTIITVGIVAFLCGMASAFVLAVFLVPKLDPPE